MKKIDEYLGQVKCVAIAGHIRPDGDCTGSCLATYNYIRTYYKDIRVDLYLEPIPNIFKFLPGADEICSEIPEDVTYDLFIAQDCGDTARLGKAVRLFEAAGTTICIDHHISNQSFADVNHIFPGASSTSELIYGLLPAERVTEGIAECIYTGIVHDTGVFQYSCTSQRTMQIAGELMRLGIPYTRIIEETFYTKTYPQNRIMGLSLIKSVLHLDGRCISSFITAAEMEEYDVLPKHFEGVVSQLRVTKGVEAAVFLYETAEGAWKVSLRSKERVDVAAVAVQYGGGGHVRAAGCTVEGEPEEIIDGIIDLVRRQMQDAACGAEGER